MLFPDFIELKLNDNFIDDIYNIISNYKNDLHTAEIYSSKLRETTISDLRLSLKKSFKNDNIKNLISERLFETIYNVLSSTNKNFYNIQIGNQDFDYIVYKSGGYFEKHRDFVRINNDNFQQYTLLIGLSDLSRYDGGSTILWFPLENDEMKKDYNEIINSNDIKVLDTIFKKYKISYYSEKNLFEKRELIVEKSKENNSEFLPKYFNTIKKGEALLFKSNLIHSGEKFFNYEKDKELLMLTINITGSENYSNLKVDSFQSKISLYPKFENWMIDFINNNNIIPFQYIISYGDYNDEKFLNTYKTYWNFNNSKKESVSCSDSNIFNFLLKDINEVLHIVYEDSKKRLHKRHREYHIDSKVLDNSTLFNSEFIHELKLLEKVKIFNWTNNFNDIEEPYNQIIDTYLKNLNEVNKEEIIKIFHNEKVKNYWEESGCNDNGDEYDEITYLNCKIDIFYGFYKI